MNPQEYKALYKKSLCDPIEKVGKYMILIYNQLHRIGEPTVKYSSINTELARISNMIIDEVGDVFCKQLILSYLHMKAVGHSKTDINACKQWNITHALHEYCKAPCPLSAQRIISACVDGRVNTMVESLDIEMFVNTVKINVNMKSISSPVAVSYMEVVPPDSCHSFHINDCQLQC